MTQREDLLARLTELDAGSQARRATARSIQKMINHGDYAGAATALDALETALHPALAAGGGGVPSLQTGAMVHLGAQITDYAYGNVAFDTVAYDSDGFWDSGAKVFTVPAGLGGLYLIQAQIALTASQAVTGAAFQITLDSTLWNYDPIYFDLVPAVNTPANTVRGSFAMVVHMADTCASHIEGDAGSPFRPTKTINLLPDSCYFGIWRFGSIE